MEAIVFKKVTHYIYDSVEEFEKEFMIKEGAVPKLLKNWKEGDIGDWVVSDDNRICQIFSRKLYPRYDGRKSIFIRTVVGTFVVQTDKMDTDMSLRKYPQGRYMIGKNYAWWKAKQKFRSNLTSNEKKLIQLLFKGEEKVTAYFTVYKCLYMSSAKRKVENLLKQPRIIKAIMGKSPKELAEELGIGVKAQLEKYKELLKDEKNFDKVMKILESLGKVVDINEERTPNGLPSMIALGRTGPPGDQSLLEEADDDIVDAVVEND